MEGTYAGGDSGKDALSQNIRMQTRFVHISMISNVNRPISFRRVAWSDPILHGPIFWVGSREVLC